MTFVITATCLGRCDTKCVEVCMVDAIHGPLPVDEIKAVKAAGGGATLASIQLYIDPETCIECGACEPECPNLSIFEVGDVPDELKHSIEANADFFKMR